MVREGLKATTFPVEVWDTLEDVRRIRGYRSIAETIAMLATEAKIKIENPGIDQVRISGTGKASSHTKAAFTLPAERCALEEGHAGNHMSLSDMSREGFEPPERQAIIPGSIAHAIVSNVYNFSEL